MIPRSLALPALADATARRESAARLEEEVISLFDQSRDRLLRYLLTFGLTIHDGEEVVQEVFLALFQHLARGRSRENLPAWLFRVAHNLALKRRYRLRRGVEVPHEDALEADKAVDPGLSPEESVIHGQRRERLLAVIDALPELDRRCLSLRSEGLRYRQIARVLDMSLGSVSASLARSLARMTRAVER
jgi:RNA polymerase sigma-70 factor (ECF subfamily)